MMPASRGMGTFLSVVLISSALGAPALSPQNQTIFANAVAAEFSSVCIKTDAEIAAAEAAASRRKWLARPADISGAVRTLAKAWDAAVRTYSGREVAEYSFTAGVGEHGGERWCEFVTPELSFSALRSALLNQGFELKDVLEYGSPNYELRQAVFCAPDVLRNGRAYDISVISRRVDDRPWFNGRRLVFVRSLTQTHSLCPITLYLGRADGPAPQKPIIEPWLGQKADGPPTQNSPRR